MPVPTTFHTFLKNSGSADMAVDGSSTPVTFSLSHATRTMAVVRMIVHIEDTGNFTDTAYGAIAGPHTGLLLRHVSGSTTTDLLDGLTISSTFEWARYCYDTQVITPSSGAKTAVVRWTFGKYSPPGHGGLLVEPGDSLQAVVQDNWTDLTEHYIICEGFYR